MDSLRNTHTILLKERCSAIRRGLLDKIDRSCRLIAIKGSRGVGKTNFLLDYCKEYYAGEESCLYVSMNNLFFADAGLYNFVEHFYKLGGKVLMLDQVHKYPGWDRELQKCYYAFSDLQIIFTVPSIVRVKSNEYLSNIVEMYNLSGLSFREFLELETGLHFPVYSFAEIVGNHEALVDTILDKIRPLAYFRNYLQYGYYPIYLEEKSHIDYLLKNINLTLEFDIPFNNQIELKYLPKLKKLLYVVVKDGSSNVNISRLSHEIGVSRATVLNYLYYLRNARLITLLQEENNEEDSGRKPNKLYIHNPNLLHAVCLDEVDAELMRKTFFLSQLCPVSRINYAEKADFLVDSSYRVKVRQESRNEKVPADVLIMEDMIERGKGNIIPLWLTGFVY